MSRVLTLVVAAVVLVAGVRVAEAMCASRSGDGSVAVWPAAPLTPSGFVALSGPREVIRNMASFDLRLRSDGEAVPVDVVFIAKDGDVVGDLALVRPRWPLSPGKSYTLDLGTQRFTWSVAAADVAPPVWRGSPRVVGRDYSRMGCGPSSHLLLDLAVTGTRDLRLRVRATALASGKVSEHLIPIEDGRASIGRGMCGGPFDLEADALHAFEVSVIDTFGHEVPAPGPRLVARAPGPQDDPAASASDAPRRPWWRSSWPYGIGLIGLAFTLGGTFLCVRFILRSGRRSHARP